MNESPLEAAIAAYRGGDLARAEQLLQEAVKLRPDDVDARLGLGMVAAALGWRDMAIERMMDVLQLDPSCLQALQYLAVLCAEAGRDDEGIEYADQFLRLRPDHGQVLEVLGTCLARKVRLSEALLCFDRALAAEPNVASLHFGRAATLRRLSRDREAAESLQRCVDINPAFEPLLRLGEVELEVGRLDDAESAVRRALALDYRQPHAHAALARILEQRGMDEAAEAEWARARQLEPEPGWAAAAKAEAAIGAGDFETASVDLRDAIRANPRRGATYRALMFAQRVGERDRPLIPQMEDLLRDGSLPDADRLDIHYALGKAYDNLGDYEAAMKAYDAANALKFRTVLQGRSFDRREFSAQIDRRIALCSREALRTFPAGASESRVPIVVLGMLRSGTTLAEQILSCHPDVGAAGEQPFWVDFESEASSGDPPVLRVDRIRQLADEYVSLLHKVAPGYPRVIDKNPANSTVAGLIHLALPQAPLVRMRRNLIDVALSTWTTPMQTTAPFVCERESIVYAYREMVRLMDHWRDVIPADLYREFRYETLVDEPEPTSRELVAHCGLPWDDACLHPESNTRRVKTPSFWQVRRPVYKTSKDRWRNYEPWLGVFNALHGLN